jgi:glycosyltransferase involved in cell wall biosynthesis
MKLGIHYHIPLIKTPDNKLYTLGFFGVFLDSLANEVDELICFLHSPLEREKASMDYCIKSSNITLVDIGPHDALYYRLIRSTTIKKKCTRHMRNIDALLIRTPTPLVLTLSKSAGLNKVTLLLVGDYEEGSKTLGFGVIKNFILKKWGQYYNYRLKKLIAHVNVITNSDHLKEKFKLFNNQIRVITTTTLSKHSFFYRNDTCNNPEIKLLYTGRIDTGKGILEMGEALYELRKKDYNVHLNIAGWDDDRGLKSTNLLKELARNKGIVDYIHFLGRKQIGDELNNVYRNADIYLMCSQLIEGFPRTIWEAMANSLPVIATKVGSMPHFLSNKKTALLIDPMNVHQLVNTIEELINNSQLRKTLIIGGFELAQQNTLETQAKKMIQAIKKP